MSDPTTVLINLLGAAALLLWGLRMVGTGMTRAFGAGLRKGIGVGTRNRFLAFLGGLSATLALQSSTATALMTASFTARGLMSTAMALAVMLGADVGTALVAQVLSFDIRWLSPVLIFAGVILYSSGDGSPRRALAQALVGLGLMLLALQLLSAATLPMRESPTVQTLLTALGGAPVLAVLTAALLTALAHSSLAVILIILPLAAAGTIDAPLALVLVLGANLGAVVPPLLATTGLGPLARRVPVGNALVRLTGCLVALPLLPFIIPLLAQLQADPARLAVNFHLAFNLALVALFLPLVGPLARLVGRLLPEHAADEDPKRPRYLDESLVNTPSVALAAAMRETLRVGDMVETMLCRSLDVLRTDNARLRSRIGRMDDAVDSLHSAIKLYLARLSRSRLDENESRKAGDIMTFAINLEHIGDIIDRSLMDGAERKMRDRLSFSEEGLSDITALHTRTCENMRLALAVFMSSDVRLARQLVAEKDAIRALEHEAAERHLDRIRQGRIDSIDTSALHLDILRDLKRINAHITAVAYPILTQAGELRESRLRVTPTRAAGGRS